MKKYFLGALILLGLAFVGLIVTGFYFNRIMHLPTPGMSNTILVGEQILCTGVFSNINRGDIMIFKYPKDPKINYCMRVIGLPGETIQIRGQKVFINNKELQELRVQCEPSYLDDKSPLREFSTEGSGTYSTYHDRRIKVDDSTIQHMKFGIDAAFQIPAEEYFMMGDSRDNSEDSRYWGTVKTDFMQYKARKIISSPDPIRNFSDLK
jgi:signal peptidase I